MGLEYVVVHVLMPFLVFRIKRMKEEILNPASGLPDEMLYGRAGYLYSLLLVQREVSCSHSLPHKFMLMRAKVYSVIKFSFCVCLNGGCKVR